VHGHPNSLVHVRSFHRRSLFDVARPLKRQLDRIRESPQLADLVEDSAAASARYKASLSDRIRPIADGPVSAVLKAGI
jgi:hypothetical protein